MRRTRGMKDLITGKAVLLPQPPWFMKEITDRYDKLAEETKKAMNLRKQQIRDKKNGRNKRDLPKV